MLRMTLFLVSLAAGGAAGWITLATLERQAPVASAAVAPAMAPAPAMREILVAVDDVNSGVRLSGAELAWRPWPEEAMHAAFIKRDDRPEAIEDVAGSMVRHAIASGEPVREEKLARGSGLMSATLPSGRRAVAIRVSAENTAGGFILPNDRVDVLHTSSRRSAGGSLTQTILRNVRVLAIDQRVREDGREATVGRTATLELDPRQSESIMAAESSGTLSLALRSVDDNGEAQFTETQAGPRPDSRSIRIFRGGRSEIVPIR